jgi:integrase
LLPNCCQERTVPRKALNDRTLKALKPAAKGTANYRLMDAAIGGFGVRVSETGRVTFILAHRFPGGQPYAARALGVYGRMSLDQARTKARHWLELISRGIDPRAERERLEVLAQRKRDNSFRMVAEAYIAQAVIGSDPDHPKMRKAGEAKRVIEKDFITRWGGRPVEEITSHDVAAAVETVVARGSPGQARNTLAYIKTLFSWAAGQKRFGLTTSPCRDLKAKHLIGTKSVADRILSDIEIAAFWRNVDRLTPTDPRFRISVGRLGYPYGPLYRLLLLTGLRLNEVADATWDEFDLKQKLWVIPKERMKGTNEKARAHTVPLTLDMLAILDQLPRFKAGQFLFSTSAGKSPVWMSDKIKKKLDARMIRSLRALARKQGDDPARVKLSPWVNHDLRRTLRSGLSRLRVDHDVKEALLAHAKPGLAGVYDRYDLLDEKREALTLWAGRVRDIVNPPPANVVKLARA